MNNSSIFDTSQLNIKTISEDEFLLESKSKLEEILSKEFKGIPIKQRIKKSTLGLNFACPFCGDSATDIKKKRAHLILHGKWAGYFKCFNCGKFMKIHNFFKSFDTSISLSALSYISNKCNNDNIGYSSKNTNELTSEILNKDEILPYAVSREYLKQYLGLIEIDKNNPYCSRGYAYLINRCQYNFNNFLYDPKGQYIIILNNIDNDKIFGLQIRDITGKRKAKYLTLSLSKIHQNILKDNIEINPMIDSLSTIFNIFNIDVYRPVLVTEGPFDAFLLPNCIATSGANKSIGIDLPFWYVYDSDKTGVECAMKMLSAGYYVFMWEKLKKELNLPIQNPYTKKYKWDINDVIMWCRDTNYTKKIYWSQYFSNSVLDGLDI